MGGKIAAGSELRRNSIWLALFGCAPWCSFFGSVHGPREPHSTQRFAPLHLTKVGPGPVPVPPFSMIILGGKGAVSSALRRVRHAAAYALHHTSHTAGENVPRRLPFVETSASPRARGRPTARSRTADGDQDRNRRHTCSREAGSVAQALRASTISWGRHTMLHRWSPGYSA
jgi:hypothetical protein